MSLLEIEEITFMRDSDKQVPEAGGVGEPRGKRGVPGREDVVEDTTPQSYNMDPELLEDGITLDDLKMVLALFDACSQRGAFRVSEFTIVGKLCDRFSNFITKSEEQK